jgi:hypothetical protein
MTNKVRTGMIIAVLMVGAMLALSPPIQAMARLDTPLSMSGLLDSIDGRSIWANGSELEALGASLPAYRCAGSAGANQSAQWMKDRFEDLGLECWLEEYEFCGWDLRAPPLMEVVRSNGTGQDRWSMPSFQAEHFSYASAGDGSVGEIMILPLPVSSSYEDFVDERYHPSLWQGLDIRNKVVLVGREVRWNSAWEAALVEKLGEGPVALVFYYSQEWTSPWEVMFMASSGGRPLSALGAYLHAHGIPAGSLAPTDSERLLGWVEEGTVSGRVIIQATSAPWANCNVVAMLPGESGTEEMVLLSAHYDSIMGPGFIDNAVGAATLLEVASALHQARISTEFRQAPALLFVAFSGEEQGMAGSSFYYAKHIDEMEQVRAVINIDSIGAGTLICTPTEADGDLDLDELVETAASETGMISLQQQASSDQESFLHPESIAGSLGAGWGMSPSLPDEVHPVPCSICISSGPLTPRDASRFGQGGWIHTSRDSSAYASASGWVSEQMLEKQAEIVLRVCLEVIGTGEESPSPNPVPMILLLATVSLATLAAYLLYFGRKAPKQ